MLIFMLQRFPHGLDNLHRCMIRMIRGSACIGNGSNANTYERKDIQSF